MKRIFFAVTCIALIFLSSSVMADQPSQKVVNESLIPACVGGPIANDPHLLTLRWFGTVNFELAYRNQVILVNAYINRGPRARPTGVTPGEISRVDALFLDHAHFDHMSDAAQVALQTGTKVFGAQPMVPVLQAKGVPANQIVVINNGDTVRFNGFTVRAILAHHSVISGTNMTNFRNAINAALPPTPEEAVLEAAIDASGSRDPAIAAQGTLAYLFEFDDGFKMILRGSAGPIPVTESAALAEIGPVDLAVVSYQAYYLAQLQIPATLPILELYNPKYYIPNHHDMGKPGTFLDMGLQPLWEEIAVHLPNTEWIEPLYSRPISFNTKTGTRYKKY
jgi:L-ascorbate metabolism protein UlaG (beta-lactamase superfamily)